MKKMKLYLTSLMVIAILFSSCSKEENEVNQVNDKASLSFSAIVQNLTEKSGTKQSNIEDLPVCSDDAPAYVEIILMQGDTDIVGSVGNPFRIDLVAGQLFTKEVPELELEPGDYSLVHFTVYNAAGDVIWIAPKGGILGEFIDRLLPYDISLGAGVKKYIDVSVLCYDQRNVNDYGYGFFDFNMTQTFEYCFFANYCDEDGRHYPARYSVDVSINGEPVITGATNTTGTNEEGDLFAEPLCLHLPNLPEYADDEDYLDFTVTLLDWEGVYDAPEMDISGSLSRDDVRDNFDGAENIDYRHLKFGCDDEGGIPAGVPAFDAATFSNPTNITNPFYALSASTYTVYEYETYEVVDGEIGSEPVENIWIELTSETKMIMGITTVVQHDVVYVDGILLEDTYDWLAQDDSGNLWYMGESVKNYNEAGEFLNTDGSWEAGVDGALPGYWLPADPYVGQFYYQEYLKGEAEDFAEVVALDETVTIDMGTYEHVLITKDENPFEPGIYELKYYAPGTGLIMEEGYEDGELVEVVVLTGIIME